MNTFLDETFDLIGDMYEVLYSQHVVKTLECSTEQEIIIPEPIKKLEELTAKLSSRFKVLQGEADYLRGRLACFYEDQPEINP
jgi:hypothetical protein